MKRIAFHPLDWHSRIRLSYLLDFINFAIITRSSIGTVSSRSMTVLSLYAIITPSGLKVVKAISEGNIKLSSRSNRKPQSSYPDRREPNGCLRGRPLDGLSPDLTDSMYGKLNVLA